MRTRTFYSFRTVQEYIYIYIYINPKPEIKAHTTR